MPSDLDKKMKEVRTAAEEEEAAQDAVTGKSDDEILAEFDEALGELHARRKRKDRAYDPRAMAYPMGTAPGSPFSDDHIDVGAVKYPGWRFFRNLKTTEGPVSPGSPDDWNSDLTYNGKGETLAPFSGMVETLEQMRGTPEYDRVKALYGPARIAYQRKQNAAKTAEEK